MTRREMPEGSQDGKAKSSQKKRGTPSKNGHVRKSAELLRRYAVKLVPIKQLKPSPENEEIYGPIESNLIPFCVGESRRGTRSIGDYLSCGSVLATSANQRNEQMRFH